MGKSADAFRTISEVAEWLGVQAHVLRFWESKFSQIKPVKRAGGRRYYRPNDMLLIGGIKHLLHDDGLTIKGVQKILRDEGVAHVAGFSKALNDLTDEEDAPKVVATKPVKSEPKETQAPDPAPADAKGKTDQDSNDTAPDDQAEAPFIDAQEEQPEAEVVQFSGETAADVPDQTPAAAAATAEPKQADPQPSKIKMPDLPPIDTSDPDPGILHHAFACKRVTRAQAEAMQPYIDRLQGLRDQMAAQRR